MQDWFAMCNINENSKRQIRFPDITITFQKEDITKKLPQIKDILSEYIDTLDFDVLNKIKKYHIYYNFFGNESYVLYMDTEKESLRTLEAFRTLKENKGMMINKQTFQQIVGDYLSPFLGIDQIFDNQSTEQPIIGDKTHLIEDSQQTDPIYQAINAVHYPNNQNTRNLNQPETLFNDESGQRAIVAGRPNLLYSYNNVGKGYFAIEVAKSPLVKKPLYIMLDDMSDEQTPRIKHPRLEDKITLIDYKEWKKRYKDIKAKIEAGALNQAFLEKYQEFIGLDALLKINERKEQIVKLLGFKEKILMGNLLVLDRIFQEAITNGQDLIIIDYLQGLMKHLTFLD
jgi:hypothetical protein